MCLHVLVLYLPVKLLIKLIVVYKSQETLHQLVLVLVVVHQKASGLKITNLVVMSESSLNPHSELTQIR